MIAVTARHHKKLRDSEKLKLPCPRLQLTWVSKGENWSESRCYYTVVIPLGDIDIRGNDEDGNIGVHRECHAVIGATDIIGGGKPENKGRVRTPFRDGAHILWDSKAMNLPAYAVCDGVSMDVIAENIEQKE